MSEVSVVMQMYQSLSPEEKAAFLRMLGLPPELTEIIDSETSSMTAARMESFSALISGSDSPSFPMSYAIVESPFDMPYM